MHIVKWFTFLIEWLKSSTVIVLFKYNKNKIKEAKKSLLISFVSALIQK